MEIDPNSLDPELRTARYYALGAAALGLISLCAAIVPACGGLASALGLLLGFVSLKTERSNTAIAGVALSALGFIITLVYITLLLLNQ
jgi:hypothetical protein